MLRPWQRIAGCTAAAVVAVFLSGCEVHGTVDVTSGTQAEANLIFTDAEVDCLGLTKYAGLVIKGSPESDGNQTCRAQGTIDTAALKDFGIELSEVGEFVTMDLALPEQFGYMPAQVDITFPGQVLQDGGLQVSGTSVRLGGDSGTATLSPVRVVALSHAGPQWWVMALLGGFGGGVALTVLGLLLVRRNRHLRETFRAEAEQPPAPDATSHEASSPPQADPPVAPDPGTRGPVRDAAYEALFAPPGPGTAATHAPAPVEPQPPPATNVDADHTMWAPPEDSGRPID